MNKAWTKIKKTWEENPIQVIIVASLAATAAAKLIEANTSRSNSKAWQKEVDRRVMMGK
jgi:hypothetical protein